MAAPFHSFEALVENNPGAISVIDKDDEIIYSSAAITRMLGYWPSELSGQKYFELIHPEDRESSSRSLLELTAKPSNPHHWELRIRHKDGDYRWVEISAYRLLLDLDFQGIAIYLLDIEDRLAAAEQQRLQTEAILRSNVRMEESPTQLRMICGSLCGRCPSTRKFFFRRFKWTVKPRNWLSSLLKARRECLIW